MMMFFDDSASLFHGFQDFQALDSSADPLFPPQLNQLSQLSQLSAGPFAPAAPGSASETPQSSDASGGSSTLLRRAADGESHGDSPIGTGPGAGPHPTTDFENGTGTSNSSSGSGPHGNTLTEFTKRKNWPAKIVEELCDLLLIIEPNGRIRFASARLTDLLGYSQEEAMGQLLTDLVHVDDRAVFVAELNACIANATLLRMYYRLRRRDGTYAVVETVGHAHIADSHFAPNPANKSAFCQAVFLMSRPYPTKNGRLLDSFLEHKMENERLRRRIDDIRHEDASEDLENNVHTQNLTNLWRQSVGSRSDDAGLPGTPGTMAPPPPPTAAAAATAGGLRNAALTRENLEGIAARPPDSLHDKMERYKGAAEPASNGGGGGDKFRLAGPMGTATHADTIEMLTGLRYQEGERSKGLSTGNRSPRLMKGDAGIAFSVNREQRSGEKKKKIRLAEEYVCTDCGTLESPEWRKGPNGPKTLCNACGLRWAKKEKKREQTTEVGGSGSPVRNWDE